MKNIAIFASGSGSNAENIVKYFQDKNEARVKLILTNNKKAYVIQRAKKLKVPLVTFDRDTFYKTRKILQVLQDKSIDFVVLAGFMWLVPDYLVSAYPDRIVNIHPALLPRYGGKGMYGERVHQAVIDNQEEKSGITIHKVNERYDEGQIVFQAECPVLPGDAPADLAKRVHELEYEHYPEVIFKELKKIN
jgi:phosphoribosylglycinamide formyltransferase-1